MQAVALSLTGVHQPTIWALLAVGATAPSVELAVSCDYEVDGLDPFPSSGLSIIVHTCFTRHSRTQQDHISERTVER